MDAKVWKGSRAIRNLRWEGGDYSSQKSSDAAIHTASDSPIVGAIRWDGWYGDGGVVKAVESSLGQPKYHFRLPWFARVIGEGKVSINGDSQAIMEQEIAYAAQVGLNYWAFLDYLAIRN